MLSALKLIEVFVIGWWLMESWSIGIFLEDNQDRFPGFLHPLVYAEVSRSLSTCECTSEGNLLTSLCDLDVWEQWLR